MVTADPQRRSAALDEIERILASGAPSADVDGSPNSRRWCSRPCPMRWRCDCRRRRSPGESGSASSSWPIRSRRRSSSTRGLPGIHVAARNPPTRRSVDRPRRRPSRDDDRRDAHPGRAVHLREPEELLPQGGAARVLGHPPDLHRAPPVGAHRAGSAGRSDEGARECYCHFQIERVESKERLRRIEHEIFSVLKSVFSAVEDFHGDARAVRELGAAAAQPRGGATPATPTRPRLPRVAAGRQLHLPGHACATGSAPDGRPDRVGDARSACSRTRRCCRSCSRA